VRFHVKKSYLQVKSQILDETDTSVGRDLADHDYRRALAARIRVLFKKK
jgi:hypothetical protein